MNPEVYFFALFVFGLAYLFFVIVRRARKKDPQSKEHAFEQQNKLFRMYQNLEDLMDSFEAFAEEKEKAFSERHDAMESRCEALEQRFSEIEDRFDAMEAKQTQDWPQMGKNPMPVVRMPGFDCAAPDKRAVEELDLCALAREKDEQGAARTVEFMPLDLGALGRPLVNPMPVIRPALGVFNVSEPVDDGICEREDSESLDELPNLAIKRSYEPMLESLPPITLCEALEETVVPFPKRGEQAKSAYAQERRSVNKREQILSLHKKGTSEYQIARELGISLAEVVMVCDMARKLYTPHEPR